MRRLTLLLAAMGMALLLVTGVAIADTVNCFKFRACIGTDGPDTLQGTRYWDEMDAKQGNDTMYGREGGDYMVGGPGNDTMYGHQGWDYMLGDAYDSPDTSTDGNDRIAGGQRYDELVGYGGNDRFLGRSGGDFIFAEESSENEGEDIVRGHEGNDWILARDGVKDTIICGPGKYDTVFFDTGIDTVADSCERKRGGVYSAAASSSGTTEEVSANELDALRDR